MNEPQDFSKRNALFQTGKVLMNFESQEERAKFVSLYDLAPVGYFILDYQGVITDVNQRGIDLLKMAKVEVLFKRFQSMVAAESWEDFYVFLHQTQNFSERQSAEIKLLLGNNEIAYARIEGIAVQNQDEAQLAYYITVIDITESRKAQLSLQETKERLEMILSASSTGIWTINTSENRIYLDDFSCAILEIDPGTFDGDFQELLKMVHPEDLEKVRLSLGYDFSNNKKIDIYFRMFTKSGKLKYISAKGHEVHDPKDEGKCFAGILMDITERRRLAQEAEDLRNNHQRLVLSATLMAQEKERSNISNALHDSICQLLYGIRLNLQNLQLNKNLKDDFANINQLLDQAISETRQISYELTPSVLKDFGFTAGIKEMAQRLCTPNFQITCNIKRTADLLPPQVQLYLFRIIQELINNAIKHAKASVASIKVDLQRHEVTIVVADNGVGFDSTGQEAFKKGSGLRGIKNRLFLLDGHIDLQSSATGTTITITFKNDISQSGLERI